MKPPLNTFTVDLEDWSHGIGLDRAAWSRHESRLHVGTEKLLSLLERHGAKATFFVLSDGATASSGLIKDIVSAGHEIGTHGQTHEFVYNMSPERFTEELRTSIGAVEDMTGAKVSSHRAAFFSITAKSLWAFDILGRHGIKRDSSIFPVVNYRYGIAGAPRHPFTVQGTDGSVTEFPISTYRFCGVNIPFSGGFYFRFFPYLFTRLLMKALNKNGRPVVFYLHPWELDPDHPRIPLPRRVAMTHYFGLSRTEEKIERLLRDFRFGSLAGLDAALHASGPPEPMCRPADLAQYRSARYVEGSVR